MKLLKLLKKADRTYHIKVVPDNSARMIGFSWKHQTIRRTLLTMIFIFIALVAYGTFMTVKPDLSAPYSETIKENLNLKHDLTQLRMKLVILENSLDRLERFDRKLRTMTNFSDNRRKIAIGPLSEEEMVASQLVGRGKTNEALAVKLQEKLGQLESANLEHEIDRLLQNSKEREKDLAELNNFLEDQKTLLSHIPSIWPSDGWVTSGFGSRVSPFTGARKFHEGIDIANNVGTPIHAPADGIVTYRGDRGGYGLTLVINHGYGITTRYAHVSQYKVKVGDKVKRGKIIATVGNTGRSTGPHLHYEVRLNNIPQNPRKYILD